MIEKYQEQLETIIDYYGYDMQQIKAVEELGELITEISRFHILDIQGSNSEQSLSLKNLISEIADVYIMLEQLQMMYSITDEVVGKEIHFKIDRTIDRITQLENGA